MGYNIDQGERLTPNMLDILSKVGMNRQQLEQREQHRPEIDPIQNKHNSTPSFVEKTEPPAAKLTSSSSNLFLSVVY